MKKKKYMKRLASFLMATVLLGNQVTTTSIAQATEYELSSGEVRMESGGTDTLESGPMDAPQLSEGKLSSGEKQSPASAEETTKEGGLSDTTESVPISDVKEVNALLTAVPSEEAPNTWKLRAEWTAGKLQGETVRLALVLDSFTYEAMAPDEKADEDGICHILTTEGERVSLKKESDETRPDDILLVYDQTGDGSLKLELSFSAENVLEETNSSITAEWCDANISWTVVDKKEILWQKTSREESSESDGTEEGEQAENETTEMILAEDPEATPIERPEDSEIIPIESLENPEITPVENPEETEITPTVKPEEELDTNDKVEETPEEINDICSVNMLSALESLPDGEGEILAVGETGGSDTDIDFGNWLTSVIFKVWDTSTGQWKTIEDGTQISTDDTVHLELKYAIPDASRQAIIDNDGIIVYDLPADIKIKEPCNGYLIDGGSTQGTYNIDVNGRITFTINKDFLEKKSGITGTLNFDALFQKNSEAQEGGQQKITIGNASVDVIVTKPEETTEEDHSDISVSKSGTFNIDKDSSTITYTVKVSSNSGSGTDESGNLRKINLHDYFTGGAEYVSADQIFSNMKIMKGDTEISNPNVTFSEKEFNVQLDGLKAGESYTITYSVPIDSSQLAVLNGNTTVSNKAEASIIGTKKYHSSDAWVSIYNEWINKQGSYSNGKIEWTINLNKYGINNLKNHTVSDTLPNGVQIVGDVILKDVTTGAETTISLPYTFTEDTYDVYQIKYSTTVEKTDDFTESSYTNSASFNGFTSGATVGVPSSLNISKQYAGAEKFGTAEGKMKVSWETTVKVPDGGIGTGFILTDTMDADLYMVGQLAAKLKIYAQDWGGIKTALVEGVDYEITYYDEEGTLQSINQYDDTKQLKSYQIKFLKNFSQADYSYISVVYDTVADISKVEANQKQTYTNHASVSNGTNKKEATGSWTYDSTGLFKKEVSLKKDTSGFSDADASWEYDQTDGGKIYYRITVDTKESINGTYVIRDIIPEGMTLDESSVSYSIVQDQGGYEHSFESMIEGNWFIYPREGGPVLSTIDSLISFLEITRLYNSETRELSISMNADKWREMHKYFSLPIAGLRVNYAVTLDDTSDVSKSYTNTAKLVSDGKKLAEESNTVTIKKRVLEKESLPLKGTNYLDYFLIINKEGTDLLPNSDFVEVVDEITGWSSGQIAQMSVMSNEVHVYRYDELILRRDSSGKILGIVGSPVELSNWSYTVSSTETSSTIRFSVPDATPCVVKYRYYMQPVEGISAGTTVSLQNTAKIMGTSWGDVTNDSTEGSYAIQTSSATISGSETSYTVSFYKVAQENWAKKLQGAEYTLYEWDASKDGEDKWNEVNRYTTDDKGYFLCEGKDNDNDGKPDGLKYNTAYRLVETKAPEGYLLSDTPFDFYVLDKNGSYDEMPKPSDFSPQDVSTGVGTLVDKKKTEISVEKTWSPSAPKDASVKIGLYRDTKKPEPEITEEPENPQPTEPENKKIVIFKATIDGKPWLTPKTFETSSDTISFDVKAVYSDGSSFYKEGLLLDGVGESDAKITKISVTDKRLESDNETIVLNFTAPQNSSASCYSYNETNCEVTLWNTPMLWEIIPITSDLKEVIENPSPGTGDLPDSSDTSGTIDSINLPHNNSWSYTWDNLEATDENGNPYYYWVKELTTPEGYKLTGQENNGGIESGTISLENSSTDISETSITVQKVWDENGTGYTGTHGGVEVQLYKKGGTEQEDIPVNPVQTLTSPNWSYTWENLEAGSKYYVKEITNIPGYDTKYVFNGQENLTARDVSAACGTSITVKNIRQITSIKAEKQWKDQNGNILTGDSIPDKTLTFHLYCSLLKPDNLTKDESQSETDASGNRIPDSSNREDCGTKNVSKTNLVCEWDNLYLTDDNGNLWYYYVVEDSTEYNPVITGNGNNSGTIVITNKKDEIKTSVTVQKNWDDSLESHTDYTVEVTLYNEKGTKVDRADNPHTLTEGNWSDTWDDLPAGNYYVVETKAQHSGNDLTDYTTTYQVGSSDAVSSGKDAKISGGTIIITNSRDRPGITLPGTGSKYPFVFYGLGLAFMLTALVWLAKTFKRKNIPIDTGKGGKQSD